MNKKKILQVDGMTCISCENRIETQLRRTDGVISVKASFTDATVEVIYDSKKVSLSDIVKIIEELDYRLGKEKKDEKKGDLFEIAVILLATYLVLNQIGVFRLFQQFPTAKEEMSYGMLFLVGLLTSVHCIAMCGGINLSQCMPLPKNVGENQNKLESLWPAILYNLGRVLSYTLIGGIVGALGSGISFTGETKGIVQIAAGIFMVIMGLNMIQFFPSLRRFVPRMPKGIANRIYHQKHRSNSPFYVGLLNGLMPCGPLQAMQLYALSTGSPIKGALSMFLFSLGTVPLMFGFGAISKLLSQKFKHKVMTAGAVLVVMLGITMLSNGASLSGLSIQSISNDQQEITQSQVADNVQEVDTTLASGQYEPIQVKAGIPVKWTITAEEGTVNGCNGEIVIPEYGIQQTLKTGENVIEFTPTEAGNFSYSCWMGMIRSTITVTK